MHLFCKFHLIHTAGYHAYECWHLSTASHHISSWTTHLRAKCSILTHKARVCVCVRTLHPVLSPQVCADPSTRRRPHFPCLPEADRKPARAAHSTVTMVTLEDTPPFVQGQIMEAYSANTNTENALHPVTHTWNVVRSTLQKMWDRLNSPCNVNRFWSFVIVLYMRLHLKEAIHLSYGHILDDRLD